MTRQIATIIMILALLPAVSPAQITGTRSEELDAEPLGVPVTDIAFDPADAAHPVCTPFAACPPASQVTVEYIAFGVDFTPFGGNPPVGVFTDPPDLFAGVNGAGVIDLVTATCGRIVELGTTTQGLTDFIGVSGGFVGGPSDLLLEAFDNAGVLIGSSIADDGVDGGGYLIAEVPDPSGTIASFCMSTPTADFHGVNFIYLNNPTPVPVTLQSFSIE